MMGNKTLRAIRDELLEAFAKSGKDPVESLNRELRKLKRKPGAPDREIETLMALRDVLAEAIRRRSKRSRGKPRVRS